MIEIVTWPSDLGSYDASKHPGEPAFYLEFYGETSPLFDTAHAEALRSPNAEAHGLADAPVYEYFWTLGSPTPGAPGKAFDRLSDPAAEVFVYFPTAGGWRAEELTATVRYLSPATDQQSWLEQAGREVGALQRGRGGKDGPSAQAADAESSKWLRTFTKLQPTSVPRVGDVKWSVRKVALGTDQGVMAGVCWTLPRALFQRLGGRLSGSLAVSIVPAVRQVASPAAPRPLEAFARAVVHGPRRKTTTLPPAQDGRDVFVRLRINPTLRRPSTQAQSDSGRPALPTP